MAPSFDPIARVFPERESWRFKVRVVRMWAVPTFNNPAQPATLELVLCDEFGGKIQATVRRALLKRFQNMLAEGVVYRLSYFSVIPNLGSYKPTTHEYRLIFIPKTVIVRAESVVIPQFGLSLVPFEQIFIHENDYDFLVDVVGVLTSVSNVREYEKDGKVIRMAVMELTSDQGKLDCALFADYVQQLEDFLAAGNLEQPIVVVQFAKVKLFRGKIVIQNTMHATRLLFNPDIAEVIEFRNGIALHGFVDAQSVVIHGVGQRVCLEDDFMKIHSRKSVNELESLKEDGFSIVLATIESLVEDGPWFYPACRCNRAVSAQSGIYYCGMCFRHVVHVIPRYRIRVAVCDETASAIFVLFDNDVQGLLNKSCDQLIVEEPNHVAGETFPTIFSSLVGKKMLFKVETKKDQRSDFDGSFTVRRICEDPQIVGMFMLDGLVSTPSKATFKPSFTDAVDLSADSDILPTQEQSIPCVGDRKPAREIGQSSKSRSCRAKRKLEESFDLAADVLDVKPLQMIKPENAFLPLPTAETLALATDSDLDGSGKEFVESLIVTHRGPVNEDSSELSQVPASTIALAGESDDDVIEFIDPPAEVHKRQDMTP